MWTFQSGNECELRNDNINKPRSIHCARSYIRFSLEPGKIHFIILIFQRSLLKLREFKQLAQSLIRKKWQSWD